MLSWGSLYGYTALHYDCHFDDDDADDYCYEDNDETTLNQLFFNKWNAIQFNMVPIDRGKEK